MDIAVDRYIVGSAIVIASAMSFDVVINDKTPFETLVVKLASVGGAIILLSIMSYANRGIAYGLTTVLNVLAVYRIFPQFMQAWNELRSLGA